MPCVSLAASAQFDFHFIQVIVGQSADWELTNLPYTYYNWISLRIDHTISINSSINKLYLHFDFRLIVVAKLVLLQKVGVVIASFVPH